MPRPKISVIIATRNNATTIESAICSLLRQTLTPFEVIVIDDDSVDGAAEIVAVMAAKYPNIKLIRNDRPRGTGFARNVGLASATGDYVTFQDGDDESIPYRLEMQYHALRKFPDKKLCLCNYVRVDGKGTVLQLNERRTMKCIISMMFPRSQVLEDVGYFRSKSISEDADYYERIKAKYGKECEVVVFRTLYKALFRPASSFFGATVIKTRSVDRVEYERTEEAAAAWEQLQREHLEMIAGSRSTYIPFDMNLTRHDRD